MPKVMTVKPRRIFLGVDPGASGGLCSLWEEKGILAIEAMPPTERDVWDWFSTIQSLERDLSFAVIERVGGFIAENPTPGSSMFKFGASYGGLRMALVAAGIPFEEVTPQKWQKSFGLTRGKTESKGQFKNRMKGKAQSLFPGEKITLATADAVLIAEYARRAYGGR